MQEHKAMITSAKVSFTWRDARIVKKVTSGKSLKPFPKKIQNICLFSKHDCLSKKIQNILKRTNNNELAKKF